jgi:hypothetical protein
MTTNAQTAGRSGSLTPASPIDRDSIIAAMRARPGMTPAELDYLVSIEIEQWETLEKKRAENRVPTEQA